MLCALFSLHVSWAMKPLPCIGKAKCVQVTVLTEDVYPGRQLPERIGCDQSTIARILAKFKWTGSPKDLPSSGRPKNTSPRQERV